MAKSILKNDRYRKTRGGYSRLLLISCQKCGIQVCRYQKDGPGNLQRMYVDRITESKVPVVSTKNLVCPRGHLLGVRSIYQKEKRQAFRLFVDSVTKEIIKSNK